MDGGLDVTARGFWILAGIALAVLNGCGSDAPKKPKKVLAVGAAEIGNTAVENPWITDLKVVELDGDGRLDVLVCEGRLGVLSVIRRLEDGAFEERVIHSGLSGIASVETADMDADGDLDLLLGCMGIVTPSVSRTGSVVILENLGSGDFAQHVVLSEVARVNYVAAGDLDGDGDLDLSVGQFGYHEGELRWMENQGGWSFESHRLLDLPGVVHAPIVDLDGDGDLDIAALFSQDIEELYGFFNDGSGGFVARVLYGSTNTDFGSSGLAVDDLDQDGDPDLIYTNGDGFDYATPGSRPWHGLQWLENLGGGRFQFQRIGDFPGAYSPAVLDFDGDGYRDVVVASGFNDWSDPEAVSLGVFMNDGSGGFERVDLARKPTHIVVADAGDLDGDGRIDLVTGGFYFYPPFGEVKRVSLWTKKSD